MLNVRLCVHSSSTEWTQRTRRARVLDEDRGDGGGGNRTRVRGRTGMSVYKHRSPLNFARRPVGDRPTDELALLKCRASDEWLFFGA